MVMQPNLAVAICSQNKLPFPPIDRFSPANIKFNLKIDRSVVGGKK
jgi:hypothetical protein